MKQLLTAYILLFTITCFSQKQKKYVITLENFTAEKISIPFRTVKVIDARLDQENVGCIVTSLSFKGITSQKKLAIYPTKLSIYLPVVLSNLLSFDETSTDTLLLLVKQFRISDHVPNQTTTFIVPETVLTISYSFFLLKDNIVRKIDGLDKTVGAQWNTEQKPDNNEIPSLRSEATNSLLQHAFERENWTAASSSFSIAEMEMAIQKKLFAPVFYSTEFVAGVYKTFDEFLKNAPSITDIVYSTKYGEVVEVMDKSMNNLATKDYWGFCDGKNRYTFFQKGLCKLDTVGKTFSIRFYRRAAEANYVTGQGSAKSDPTSTLWVWRKEGIISGDVREEYLHLNMDNGKIHVEEVIGTAPMRKFRGKSK